MGVASEAFVRWLRQALHHLYDPPALSRNPLARILGLDAAAGPSELRRVLTAAVAALHPSPQVSLQSDAWRTYKVLQHRYVEQFSQGEVAESLGLSVRQLRRQEALALRTLADYLWNEYGVRPEAAEALAPAVDGERGMLSAGAADASMPFLEGDAAREHELAWLEHSLPSEPADVAALVQTALQVAERFGRERGVAVEARLPPTLPRVAIRPTAIRQALLTLLSAAISATSAGTVRVIGSASAATVTITVTWPSAAREMAAPSLTEGMEMARRLAALSGATVEAEGQADASAGGAGDSSSSASQAIALRLPLAEQVAVLVIDDNADTLQLLQRHLAGTRYRFMGARDPEQGLALAASWPPRAIVLDVMLPGMDGWELLGRLREHPQTRGVPIIVCTILPQEELALTLGAAAFLRKPVRRDDLLATLDRWTRSALGGESGS